MPEFSHIYDGKNTAVTLPSGERLDRAQERLSDTILNADKLKLEAFKEAEEYFLNATNIDVESFIASANTKVQADQIDANNEKWSNRLKERGGSFSNFTTQDKLEMNRDRQVIESAQKKMLGDLEKYNMARDTISRSKDLDMDKFNKLMTETYFQSGVFPDLAELPYKSKSLSLGLRNMKVKGTPVSGKLDYRTLEGGKKQVGETAYSGTEGEAREQVKQVLFSDRGYMEGILEEFDALTDDAKLHYLDANEDGKISEEEEKLKDSDDQYSYNPLVAFAQDKYWREARGTETSWKNVTVPTTKDKGIIINIGGQKTAMSPGYKRATPVPYGDKVYYNTYGFSGTTTLSNISTDGGVAFEEDDSFDLGDGNIQGILKDYVADGDLVIIEAKKAYPDYYIKSGGLVAIPAKNIQGSDNLPIIDENGNQTTVGAIKGTQAGGGKLVYNKETGKFE